MSQIKTFPVRSNISTIPADFQCFQVDMQPAGFENLKNLGCTCIIAVNSPVGWQIKRSCSYEVPHIDLFFIASGLIQIRTASETTHAGAGQVMIVPSWIDRIVEVKDYSEHIYIRIDIPDPQNYSNRVNVRTSLNIEPVCFYTRMLLLTPQHLPDDPAYVFHLAECLAILLHRELHPQPMATSPERSKQLLQQLQTAGPEQLKVKCVAREFHMSISAFRQFCLLNFGKSPNRLINEVRMSRASALLNYSNFSIDEIAEQLGYSDRFSFSKAFHRFNGCSPGGVRRGRQSASAVRKKL